MNPLPALLEIPCIDLAQDYTPEGARQALEQAPALELKQHWLPQTEPGFRPGRARLAWTNAGELLVLAELQDRDIHAERPTSDRRLWRLGDLLEVFIRPEEAPEYYELHVTPNGDTACLHWPSFEQFMELSSHPSWPQAWGDYVLEPVPFTHCVRVQPADERWEVLVRIPVTTMFQGCGLLEGSRWRVNISRYDFTRGDPQPVLSATAHLPRCAYHLVEFWNQVQLGNQAPGA